MSTTVFTADEEISRIKAIIRSIITEAFVQKKSLIARLPWIIRVSTHFPSEESHTLSSLLLHGSRSTRETDVPARQL